MVENAPSGPAILALVPKEPAQTGKALPVVMIPRIPFHNLLPEGPGLLKASFPSQ
jgi:hypothetical protein